MRRSEQKESHYVVNLSICSPECQKSVAGVASISHPKSKALARLGEIIMVADCVTHAHTFLPLEDIDAAVR